MASKGFLNYIYNWGFHYYTLTNSGLEWIKTQFGITDKVIPVTFKANKKTYHRAARRERGAPQEGGDAAPQQEGAEGRAPTRGGRTMRGRGGARGGY